MCGAWRSNRVYIGYKCIYDIRECRIYAASLIVMFYCLMITYVVRCVWYGE